MIWDHDMASSTHSPGQWSQRGRCVLAGDVEIIATYLPYVGPSGDREARANARLCSAAPDMLEALRMVRDADDDCHKDGLPTMPSLPRAKIDQAIAKAEGRSSGEPAKE